MTIARIRGLTPEIAVATPKRKQIAIGLPAYGGIEAGFLISLIALLPHLAERGVDSQLFTLEGESLITRGRNRLVHRFLESKCDGLLFLDCDLKFDAATVTDMVLSGLSVIGAPYTVKAVPGRLACTVKTVMHDGVPKRARRGRYVLAHDVATGCMYVDRSVFAKLAPLCATFTCDMDPDAPEITAYFDSSIETLPDGKRRYLSEDYHFARLCTDAGIECWLDQEAKLVHVGKYPFTAPSLREQWESDKAKEAAEALDPNVPHDTLPPAARETEAAE